MSINNGQVTIIEKKPKRMTRAQQNDTGAGVPAGTTISQAQFEAWMSEIATLINTKPLTIIQTIELTTNKKFIGTTYGDLARAVGTLLKTNGKFQAAMVILVHLENGEINYDQIASGDYLAALYRDTTNQGAKYKNDASDPFTGILNLISSGINAGANIASASLAKQTAKINAGSTVTVAGDNLQAADDTADAAIKTELMRTVQVKLSTDAEKSGASAASGTAGSGSGGSNNLLIAIIVLLGIGGVFLFSRSVGTGAGMVPIKATGGPAVVPPLAAAVPPIVVGVTPPPPAVIIDTPPPANQLIPGVGEIKF